MRTAQRIADLPPYLFADVNRRIAAKRAAGHDVISLGAGDPDLPTPPYIVDRLAEAARQAANHRYPPYDGVAELRRAIADWYRQRFGVVLDPATQVAPLIGSKEGIAHIPLAFLDPGDVALIPSPGYPVYQVAAHLAGGRCHFVPLLAENGFLPHLADVPEDVARSARLLWLNYPNNPTAATAGLDFFQEVVAFARQYDLAVLHDNAYSEIAYDGYRPPSFLEAPGAIEVGAEFHSLSKTYNMPGWRVGMLVGSATIVEALSRIKTNVDSGIFLPVQWAAVAALTGPQDWFAGRNSIYQRRRDLMVATFRRLGWSVALPKASLYVWGNVPAGQSSLEFALRVLDETAVWITPGSGYGPHGEGYFRASLTVADERLAEAMARLEAWGRS